MACDSRTLTCPAALRGRPCALLRRLREAGPPARLISRSPAQGEAGRGCLSEGGLRVPSFLGPSTAATDQNLKGGKNKKNKERKEKADRGAPEAAPAPGARVCAPHGERGVEAEGRGRRQSSGGWGEAEPPEAAPAARISPAAPRPRRRRHVCAQATSQRPRTAAGEGLTRQPGRPRRPPPPGGAAPGPARPHPPGRLRQTAGRGRRSADCSRADRSRCPRGPGLRGWRQERRRRAPGVAGAGGAGPGPLAPQDARSERARGTSNDKPPALGAPGPAGSGRGGRVSTKPGLD